MTDEIIKRRGVNAYSGFDVNPLKTLYVAVSPQRSIDCLNRWARKKLLRNGFVRGKRQKNGNSSLVAP
ncbi:hypothetical protein [Pseudomonas baltica]|uniref:hypothetical protein n=1 Tax=Pseudomonas baltica TaxID=2762576 RepID=UPI00289EB014|nr:hypothetical protein [Pseudomonas baltica]